jgi:hypothetical protein
MPRNPIFLVVLRRPRSNADEKRSDPFWEFGSFGITTCHKRNLMNPKKAKRLAGARLAFAQGGPQGTRLVYLTPPIRVVSHLNCVEATWTPHEMPFRYLEAPRLAVNPATSDFPLLKKSLQGGKRTTLEGQFASRFRSRTTPLEAEFAGELITVYSAMRHEASKGAFAVCYTDALPNLPPDVDYDRQQTYSARLEMVTTYVASPKSIPALRKELVPMHAIASDCATCAPRRRSSRC